MRKVLLVATAGVFAAVGLGLAGAASAVSVPSTASATPVVPPAITGLQTVGTSTGFDSPVWKSVTAECPPGKSVLNGGGDITGGDNKVLFDGIYLDHSQNQVTVTGKEIGSSGTSGSWALTAYATCADTPSGLVLAAGASLSNSSSPKTAHADCPPGTVMLGNGMDIVGGQGEVGAYAIEPVKDSAGHPVGVDVWAGEIETFTGSWEVHAQIMCADEGYQPQVVHAQGQLIQAGYNGLTVERPAQLVATGGGYAALSWGVDTVVVNSYHMGYMDAYPSTPDDIWETGAYAICVHT